MIYTEEQIFSNLPKYKSDFKFAEKQVDLYRRRYKNKFSYAKYKGFEHMDLFLYNCPKCGFTTHSNDNFCTNCGSKLHNNDTYDDLLAIYNEYYDEPTINPIPKSYVLSMKDDYYFKNVVDGLLEAIFYVVTSHRYNKEYAKKYLKRIRSFNIVTQQLLLCDFRNKLLFQHNEIYGYISNWKGYKIILDDYASEVDILANICEIKPVYCPPSRIANKEIYDMGIKHQNRELRIGDYCTASKLIIGEVFGSDKCPFSEDDFVDDKLCMKLLAIASSWHYCKINSKSKVFAPTKRMFWEFVWSCQLNPSDEFKLYNFVDALVVE